MRNFHEFALDKIRTKELLSESCVEPSVSFIEQPTSLSKKYMDYLKHSPDGL